MFAAMSDIEKPAEWFDRVLPDTVQNSPEKVDGFAGTLLFNITGDGGGVWTVHIEDGAVDVEEGESGEPGFTVKMKAKNFVRMMNGEISGANAFMSGKLKFKGDVSKAIKLRGLLFA